MTLRDKMPVTVRASAKVDPTIYPVDEKVGESLLQRWIVELLRPLVDRWMKQRKVRALVGADQFIYYRQHMPTARVSPDVYVLPGVRPDLAIASWKTWEGGIAPSFALEIVSKDWEKDYVEAPERHREIGTGELIIFDPEPDRRPDGVRWQVYRRVRGRPLTLVEANRADRVRSRALGCFLRAVGTGASLRLRLGTDAHGDRLFPTAEEAERAAGEAAAAAAEAATAAERSAKEAALARLAELEAKLTRRRRRGPKRRA
jgi:Uma2 family endonuclease